VTTLAEAFSERGYDTAAFVANYANVNRAAGFDQGFDAFLELDPGTEKKTYLRAADVNERVLSWLDARGGGGAPLFLYVHFLDPHFPYLSGWPDPSSRHEAMREGYDRELRYIDGELADLLLALERRMPGVRILFTSDHGEEFGEHGAFGHGHALYREVLHVPAFVRGEGIRPGRIDARLESRDLFDLLLRLGAREAPDLGAWAERRERKTRYAAQYIDREGAPFYRPSGWFTCMRSLERDGHLLIWSAFGDTEELYDVESDRAERTNLADREPAEAASLRAALEQHPRRWRSRQPAESDSDTEEMLRALGYVR
jgi:arylsulfatase A-like enzyme